MLINKGLLGQYRTQKKSTEEDTRSGGFISYDPVLYMEDDVEYFIRMFHGHYGENGQDPALLYYKGWSRIINERIRGSGKDGAWITCNCHCGRRKVDCVPCKHSKTMQIEKGKYTFRPSPFRAMNIVHYGKYHKVPWERDGKSGTYLDLCRGGSDCKHCKAGMKDFATWRKTSLDLDDAAWREVLKWDQKIRSKCANCKDGQILPVKTTCGNCKREIRADLERMKLMETEEVVCPHCGVQGFAELEYDCLILDHRTGALSQGCKNPAVHEIWDCDLKIMQVKAKGGKGKELRLLDQFPSTVEDPEILEAMRTPCKFKSKDFLNPDQQAITMGIDNPYKG